MRLYVPNTAILLFIRNEKEEAKLKQLALRRGQATNQQIIRELNHYALEIAKSTALPVFVCTGKEQKGNNFGEKLANATEDIFQQGYNKIITIGNDCLTLTADDLLTANQKLVTNDIVLGPTPDGGVYLIGLNKTVYRREQFLKFRWESAYLFVDFCTISATNNIVILATKSDADNATDFAKIFNNLPYTNFLVRRLGQLMFVPSQRSVESEVLFAFRHHTSHLDFRGPPA